MGSIKPLGNRVVIKDVDIENTTKGGIIIPDTVDNNTNKGKIVAVSEDVDDLNVDDIVFYDKHSGVEVSYDGTDYVIIKDDDIIGLILKI